MSQQQKTPLSRTLPRAIKRGALDEIAQLGLGLPGHVVAVNGAIVTVAFDVSGATLPQVTMPLASSEYVRLPIQENDKGWALPAGVYLGGISGLGGGTADLTRRGNLSTLTWLPTGSKGWSAVDDPNKLVLYGPNGVEARDTAGAVVQTLDKTNGYSVTFGNGSIVMNSSGITLSFGGKSIVLNASGITFDGLLWDTHVHPGVQTGSGVTGTPQA